jgi:transcription antitermination factor NusG
VRWYAAYTCANHEKTVARQLAERRIEHFLPLYRSRRQWSDRRVELELPLFPSYVFVRCALQERFRLLNVSGLVRLVGFGGLPEPLADEEVEVLRSGSCESLQIRPHPFLTVGRRVRITRGPLAGLSGVLKRQKGTSWVVLSIELIQRSVMVNVEAADVMPMIERSCAEGSVRP